MNISLQTPDQINHEIYISEANLYDEIVDLDNHPTKYLVDSYLFHNKELLDYTGKDLYNSIVTKID